MIFIRKFLYFTGLNGINDYQLFKTDGTASGTILLASTIASNPSPLDAATQLFMFDSTLFFNANYNSNGYELWAIKDTTNYNPSTAVRNNNNMEIIFDVYPSPNKGAFTVHINNAVANAIVSVYDISGKLVYSTNLAGGTANVLLSNAAKGLYFVKVQMDEAVSCKRVSVE